MIYTFTKTLAGDPPYAETLAGLGASNVGQSTGQSIPAQTDIPYIEVHNSGNRRLYADDITISGFNIKADPGGADPPYDVSITVNTSDGLPAASIVISTVRKQVRQTIFRLPSGLRANLYSVEGTRHMPDELLDLLITYAAIDLNADILGLPTIETVTLPGGSTSVTAPSGMLMLKSAHIDDGLPLETQGGIAGLVREGIGLTGDPSKVLLFNPGGGGAATLYFDRAPTSNTDIVCHFFETTTGVNLDNIYLDLVVDRARQKVAKSIGDLDKSMEAKGDYFEGVARFKGIQSKRNTNPTTIVRNELV
jgi:hypothetical protein